MRTDPHDSIPLIRYSDVLGRTEWWEICCYRKSTEEINGRPQPVKIRETYHDPQTGRESWSTPIRSTLTWCEEGV